MTKKKATDKISVEKPSASFTRCNFTGVQYDTKAVNAIEMIATGLVENAKALGALAQVLKASNVSIDAVVKI